MKKRKREKEKEGSWEIRGYLYPPKGTSELRSFLSRSLRVASLDRFFSERVSRFCLLRMFASQDQRRDSTCKQGQRLVLFPGEIREVIPLSEISDVISRTSEIGQMILSTNKHEQVIRSHGQAR